MKRNKKGERLKYFRRLHSKRDELYNIESDNLELKEPYQRGWDIHVSLRDDILRREDSKFLLKLVKLGIIGNSYTRHVEDIRKIRKGDYNGQTYYQEHPIYGNNTYRDFTPGIRAFRESKYNNFSDRVKKYFNFDGKYYRLNLPSYFYVLKDKPHMITHQYLPNPEIESEIAKLDNKSTLLNIWCIIYGRGDARYIEECYGYKRAKTKVETNKLIQEYYDTEKS